MVQLTFGNWKGITLGVSTSNPEFCIFTKSESMVEIKKLVLTDDKKRPVAVQVDINTFNKIEQLLEDYALGQFIEENDPSENLTLSEAKEAYRKLKK